MTAGTARHRPPPMLSGVDAIVELLALRHRLDRRDGLTTATMVSGYPGSPLGTLDLALERAADLMAAHRVVHRPGLNEELAAATVWGSQMGAAVPYRDVDGVAGAWYGKTPGLDRAGDALKHGNAMGAGPHGGVVLFCGDDPTAKSSTLPCDSQYTFQDACIPVLVPGDQQGVVDLGVHAFWLSRFAGCWAALKIVTAVADGIGTADLGADRHASQVPDDLVVDGRPWRHRPLATIGPHAVPEQEVLVVRHRLLAAQAYVRRNRLDQVVGAGPGAPLGIVCAGKTYHDVRQALSDLGVDPGALAASGVRILRLAMTYPLVEDTVVAFAGTVDQVLVVEEKRPFVEAQLRSILHEAGCPVPVTGKRDREGRPLVPDVGELDAEQIGGVLRRVAPSLAPAAAAGSGSPAAAPAGSAPTRLALVAPPPRPPAFCSGCPHNRSTVFPAGALVGGGVGCHGIMYFEPRHRGMKSLPPTPMGAEGVPWIGLAPFTAEPHLIQNIGDGTFSHSGTLAVRACVAAGVDVTFKVLYNAAVAMTGGQEVTGLMDVPSLTRALEAEGVSRIVVCAEDPKHYGRRARWARGVEVLGRDRLPEVQERLRQVPGVTVIVYDQRCAAEARRLRRRGLLAEPPRRVVINEAVCEGCGDCGAKSNCLSVVPVTTEFGEKRQVHDPSCNRDYTCLEGDCPSFLTVTPRRRARAVGGAPRPAAPSAARLELPPGTLPTPAGPGVDGQYGIYVTGIGGTGVVTANRILATAAEASGLAVAGLDQTGLSQKAGAVVSHLRLAADPAHLGSPVIGTDGADLYLSGDLFQAAAARHLARVHPGRTVAVVDDGITPTASMLQSGAPSPDVAALKQAITERTGDAAAAFVDSKGIAERVFADHVLANVVLLGAAFQSGGLPLSAEALEQAMARQGPAAAANLAAFTWGRWAVHDPAAVAERLRGGADDGRRRPFDPTPRAVGRAGRLLSARSVPEALAGLLERRTAQVVDYQGERRAVRYLDLVEAVARRDTAGQGWALTRGVAEAWFRLLTYKDEYEVARLHLAADHGAMARELGIDGPYRVTYHLHPPALRRLGLRRKLPMGRPYRAAFHVLAGMRRVRGTPFDPFGWDRDRRMERQLIEEYRGLVEVAVLGAEARDYETCVRLARSPEVIKGYAAVKEASVDRWRRQVRELLAAGPAATT